MVSSLRFPLMRTTQQTFENLTPHLRGIQTSASSEKERKIEAKLYSLFFSRINTWLPEGDYGFGKAVYIPSQERIFEITGDSIRMRSPPFPSQLAKKEFDIDTAFDRITYTFEKSTMIDLALIKNLEAKIHEQNALDNEFSLIRRKMGDVEDTLIQIKFHLLLEFKNK